MDFGRGPWLAIQSVMLHALSAVRPGVLLVGAGVAAGLYVMHAHGTHAATPPAPQQKATLAIAPRFVAPPSLTTPAYDDETEDGLDDEGEELEEIRGMTPIEDPAELAMVFSVDGTSYVRISYEERATSHGRRRMVDDGTTKSVVASVATSALPEELRRWAGRTVLVDGTCRARVVGFAEVSRVAGDPPGTEDYYYSAEDERPTELPEWTIENITSENVMLAAQLDGCTGTWARGTEFSPAAVAELDSDPELESAALADLLAEGDSDPTQDSWRESGGEGDWREAVDPTATVYTHPLTGERWIFASAYKSGGCGDPGVEVMAAYRASANGKVHRVADLEYAGQTIDSVIDVDGDGQPELLLGGGDSVDFVDLKSTSHDSISVSYYSYGCGC